MSTTFMKRCCDCGSAEPECECACGQAVIFGYTPGQSSAGGFWCGECGAGATMVIAEEGCSPEPPAGCEDAASSYRCCQVDCPAEQVALTMSGSGDHITFPNACIFLGLQHLPFDSGGDDAIVRFDFSLQIQAIHIEGEFLYTTTVTAAFFFLWRNTDCMQMPECHLVRDQGVLENGSEFSVTAEFSRYSGDWVKSFNGEYCGLSGGTRDWRHSSGRQHIALDTEGFDLDSLNTSEGINALLIRLGFAALTVEWSFTPGIEVQTVHGPDEVCEECL